AILMRLPPAQAECARLAGLMHDIGKAMVSDELLSRAGPLTPKERRDMDLHAGHSATLCQALAAPPAVSAAVRAHHAGRGTDPPVVARIVRVADALTVMTTGRAYRAPRSFSDALAELRRGRGRDFDENAVIAAHIHSASIMALAA